MHSKQLAVSQLEHLQVEPIPACAEDKSGNILTPVPDSYVGVAARGSAFVLNTGDSIYELCSLPRCCCAHKYLRISKTRLCPRSLPRWSRSASFFTTLWKRLHWGRRFRERHSKSSFRRFVRQSTRQQERSSSSTFQVSRHKSIDHGFDPLAKRERAFLQIICLLKSSCPPGGMDKAVDLPLASARAWDAG